MPSVLTSSTVLLSHQTNDTQDGRQLLQHKSKKKKKNRRGHTVGDRDRAGQSMWTCDPGEQAQVDDLALPVDHWCSKGL